MRVNHFKKSIGTSLLAVFFAASIIGVTGKATGLFRYIGSDFKGTGKVQTVGASSFELVTSGSTWPFTMVVNGATVYGGGYTGLSSLQTGDEVQVVADRTTGDFMTLEVKKVPQPATYGNAPCDSFVISTALFERPVNNTFYVVKNNIGTVIRYDQNTQVVGGTWNDLLPSTQVTIEGYDCRSTGTLTAQTITIVTNEALARCNSFGEDAIVVRNQSVLLAHDVASAKTPFINATIPAGTYRVHGVSFDNHSTTPWDTEPSESWKITGYEGDTLTYTSGNTNDLPNGIDFNGTTVSDPVTLGDLTKVQLVHAVTPGTMGYQSVYPICAVFEPISPEVIIDERD